MNYEILDSKLKKLIELCKETKNYKKLSVVSFILVSNVLDEIGVKLGLRARDKDSGETIFRYLRLINSILKDNFKMTLFKEDLIQNIQQIEILFNKQKGNIALEYIKEVFTIYYELREIEIPNLYKKIDNELLSQINDVGVYSSLSGLQNSGKQHKNYDDKLKELLNYRLKEKELAIQDKINDSYDKKSFEKLISLKNARTALKNQDGGKIVLKGRLKDNIVYQSSLSSTVGYFIMGLFLVFFILGFLIVAQTIYHPKFTAALSILFLIFFGSGLLFFIIYKQNFRKEGSQT